MKKQILIVSENPINEIWFYLSRWESIEQAKLLISEKARLAKKTISEEVLIEKSKGLAYCLRNARDYLHSPTQELSKKLLSSYYGFMSIIGAILISNPESDYDLEKFESATKMGHGIGNIDSNESFPMAQKVFITTDGLFVRYLKSVGIDAGQFSVSNRYRKFSDIEENNLNKFFSLDSLLSRIPELRELYYDITDKPPMSIQVFNSIDANNPDHDFEADPEVKFKGKRRKSDGSWISLYSEFPIDQNYIEKILEIPLIEVKIFEDEVYKEKGWIGLFKHETEYWNESMKVYKSPLTASSWIKPLLDEKEDFEILHYLLLYSLSIIVRYRPKLWREITEGSKDNYLSIVRHYSGIFDRVIPEFALKSISWREFNIEQPGSFNAPS